MYTILLHWSSSNYVQGVVNFTSTYDSRTRDVDSSLVAMGDLCRVEVSHNNPTSRNDNSSLFLVQLGPVIFVCDATLLLPVHLSEQHLLWYGYDRKVRSVLSTSWISKFLPKKLGGFYIRISLRLCFMLQNFLVEVDRFSFQVLYLLYLPSACTDKDLPVY